MLLFACVVLLLLGTLIVGTHRTCPLVEPQRSRTLRLFKNRAPLTDTAARSLVFCCCTPSRA
jgi:hypothetical protein